MSSNTAKPRIPYAQWKAIQAKKQQAAKAVQTTPRKATVTAKRASYARSGSKGHTIKANPFEKAGIAPTRLLLENKSLYWNSLRDPFGYSGARIPVGSFPSAAFSTTYRLATTVNAAGLAGVLMNLSQAVGNAGHIMSIPAGGTEAALGWTNTTANPAASTITASFSAIRIVSAGIAVMYEGSDLNNSGAYYGLYQNPDDIATYGSLSTLENTYGASSVPVRSTTGLTTTYIPVDTSVMDYHPPNNNLGSGRLYALVAGATPGQRIQFVVRCNFEGIPLQETFSLVQPEEPIADSLEMEAVSNHYGELDTVKPNVDSAINDFTKAHRYDMQELVLMAEFAEKEAKAPKTPGRLQQQLTAEEPHQVPRGVFKVHAKRKVRKSRRSSCKPEHAKEIEKPKETTWFDDLLSWLGSNVGNIAQMAGPLLAML